MTISTNELSKLVTTVTGAVGKNEMSASEALVRLKRGMDNRFNFARSQPLWHWGNCANDLLAEIIPEKASVFVRPGDRSGPADAKLFEPENAGSFVIRAVMQGIELFANDVSLKTGASKILESCPDPVEKSATPFVDSKYQWDHTHAEPGEKS